MLWGGARGEARARGARERECRYRQALPVPTRVKMPTTRILFQLTLWVRIVIGPKECIRACAAYVRYAYLRRSVRNASLDEWTASRYLTATNSSGRVVGMSRL